LRLICKLIGTVWLTLILLSAAAKASSVQQIWPCLEQVRNQSRPAVITALTPEAAKQLARTIELPSNGTLRVHMEGTLEAVVDVVVDQEGVVQCVRFKEGDSMLAADAISASSHWTFHPYIRSGKAVPFRTTLRFRLVNHEFQLACLRSEIRL
jgi:hypothetical protein